MDDAQIMKAPPPETERPLVTFALFAYNQEKYIREAVEGAFSQTYEPLEIILSDDCSSDRTFDIMQEMAAAYEGPHEVRVRKTRRNRGTLNHCLEVAQEATGCLLVMAAGDDISVPERATILASLRRETNGVAFFSEYDTIDETSRIIARRQKSSGDKEIISWLNELDDFSFIHGATSAYDTKIFKHLWLSNAPIYNEDAVLSFLIGILGGKVSFSAVPLVKYRSHSGSISNGGNVKNNSREIQKFEQKISFFASSYVALCDYCLELLLKVDEGGELSQELKIPYIEKNIARTRRFSAIRRDWIKSGILERSFVFLRCREKREFRFMVPRLFGLMLFSNLKSLIRG